MKRASNASSSLRRFWRRQTLPSRGLSTKWIVLFCVIIVCAIKFTPNPYSPLYQVVSNEQIVHWSRIGELIQAKEIVSQVFWMFLFIIENLSRFCNGMRRPIQVNSSSQELLKNRHRHRLLFFSTPKYFHRKNIVSFQLIEFLVRLVHRKIDVNGRAILDDLLKPMRSFFMPMTFNIIKHICLVVQKQNRTRSGSYGQMNHLRSLIIRYLARMNSIGR